MFSGVLLSPLNQMQPWSFQSILLGPVPGPVLQDPFRGPFNACHSSPLVHFSIIPAIFSSCLSLKFHIPFGSKFCYFQKHSSELLSPLTTYPQCTVHLHLILQEPPECSPCFPPPLALRRSIYHRAAGITVKTYPSVGGCSFPAQNFQRLPVSLGLHSKWMATSYSLILSIASNLAHNVPFFFLLFTKFTFLAPFGSGNRSSSSQSQDFAPAIVSAPKYLPFSTLVFI